MIVAAAKRNPVSSLQALTADSAIRVFTGTKSRVAGRANAHQNSTSRNTISARFVCAAQSGEEALGVLSSQAVDLLLTDFVMPGISA